MAQPFQAPSGREPDDAEDALSPVLGPPTRRADPTRATDQGELTTFVTGLAEGEANIVPPAPPDEGLDLSRFVTTRPKEPERLQRRSSSGRRARRRRRRLAKAAIAAVAVLVVVAAALATLT